MKKSSLEFVAFLQAMGLFVYCLLVGLFFWNAQNIFPAMNSFLGPTLLLVVFVFSAIICTLIFAYNAFIVFWEQKNTKKAVRLILATTIWFIVFAFYLVFLLVLTR